MQDDVRIAWYIYSAPAKLLSQAVDAGGSPWRWEGYVYLDFITPHPPADPWARQRMTRPLLGIRGPIAWVRGTNDIKNKKSFDFLNESLPHHDC